MFQTLNPNVSLIMSCMFDVFALGNSIFGRGGGIVWKSANTWHPTMTIVVCRRGIHSSSSEPEIFGPTLQCGAAPFNPTHGDFMSQLEPIINCVIGPKMRRLKPMGP